MAAEDRGDLTASRGPKPDRFVARDRGNAGSIGRPTDRIDEVVVSLERVRGLGLVDPPDLDRAIGRSGGDTAAVWTPADALDRAVMPPKHGVTLAARGVPEPHRSVIAG